MKEHKNVHQAMASAMEEIEAIGKDRRNQQQGFNFRGIDDLYNTVHGILANNGLFTLPEVLEDKSEEREARSGGRLIYRILKIKYHFSHASGTEVCAIVIGEGMDSADKASNKAMAVAHKYALLQAFSIPTEDQPGNEKDPDYHTPPESRPAAARKPTGSARKPAGTPAATGTPEDKDGAAAANPGATQEAGKPGKKEEKKEIAKFIALVVNSPKLKPIVAAYLAMHPTVSKMELAKQFEDAWNAKKGDEAAYLAAVEQIVTVPAPAGVGGEGGSK